MNIHQQKTGAEGTHRVITTAAGFSLDSAVEILERTPAVLGMMLGGLSAAWTSGHEGGESWSPYDVAGHLLHSEQEAWMPRIAVMLSAEGVPAFAPFDRFAHCSVIRGRSMEELLAAFRYCRRESLDRLRAFSLQEADLARTAVHPALGSVTLQQLISTWVVHDLNHTAQIARVMAKQYSGNVGPWAEYLPILQGS